MDDGLFATLSIILFQFRKNKVKIEFEVWEQVYSKEQHAQLPFFFSFSVTAVTKNNVFMPSSFCEPSTGNSDSEPGQLPHFSAFFLELLICCDPKYSDTSEVRPYL